MMLNAIVKNLASSHLRRLEKFGGRINKFGLNFAVCNVDGELVLQCEGGGFKSSAERLIKFGLQVLSQDADVCQLDERGGVLGAVVKTGTGRPAFAALIDLGDNRNNSDFIVDNSRSHQLPTAGGVEYFSEMLVLLAESFQTAAEAEEQIDEVSTELAQVYEELVLLHKLSTNMKVNESDANYLQMACDSLTDIVSVEGIAILLAITIEDETQLILAAGSGLIDIDDQMAAVLHRRLAEEINCGKDALLDSEVDSAFRYAWPPNIRNIIAVPLFGKDKAGSGFTAEPVLQEARAQQDCRTAADRVQIDSRIIGLMVAINRVDKADFDSTDAKLFNSVANSCAVFIENGRLFKELKELFIGSLKALTSSIDAKDQYTRGHSERVAYISRWIAERLVEKGALDEEQMHKVYLAGLLHDIGKIGTDETVLRKEGELTEEELNRIQMHPKTGAGILGEIIHMRDIVPGVLCHHERIDGGGYPNGLTGEQIPLIGKIIGLADSFDAMTSERIYRGAMTVDEALAEIEKGLGTQFDEEAGRVFINSNAHHLWNIIRDGFTEPGAGSLSEYGSVAVGTLIR